MELISFLSPSRKVHPPIRLTPPGTAQSPAPHYRPEILLRWEFRHPESSGPNQRRAVARAVHGRDAGQLTVNGELNKLANNVSFGHGILAGIHWRTDTSSSIQLGEAVTISMLQDRAATYAEKFTINLTKIDGSTATISNQ